MEPCEERIVVALERAVQAIDHIAACWRDEAARAVTSLAQARSNAEELSQRLLDRTKELATTRDEASAKIGALEAEIAGQRLVIQTLTQHNAKNPRRKRP